MQAGELVRQPRDAVALAAARAVLDQVAPARTIVVGIGQQLAHHVQLVVAREDLRLFLAARLRVLELHHLRVVLQDVGEAERGEHALPEVVGLEALRVRRIARAIVVALVEGQEPTGLAFQFGAEFHLRIVHGEVHHAAAELEEQFLGVAVALVLLHGILHRLLGEAVLQLEGGDGQAVEEEAEVQRELGVVRAEMQLAGDAEAVVGILLLRGLVAQRGRGVVQVDVQRTIVEAFAQHVDHTLLGDHALQAGQEGAAAVAVVGQVQFFGDPGLCGFQEEAQLAQVHGVGLVVIGTVAGDPALAIGRLRIGRDSGMVLGFLAIRLRGQLGHDQAFEAFFAGVCCHLSVFQHESRLQFAQHFDGCVAMSTSKASHTVGIFILLCLRQRTSRVTTIWPCAFA